MRSMCGLPENCGEEAFPKWYRNIFAKHQDEKDKGLILAAAIDKSFMFDDAEVPVIPIIRKNDPKTRLDRVQCGQTSCVS